MRNRKRAAVTAAVLTTLVAGAPTAAGTTETDGTASRGGHASSAPLRGAVRAAPGPAADRAAALAAHIVNYGSRKCLAVPGGSHEKGIGLIQWGCGGWKDHFWSAEQWTIDGVPHFRVINDNSKQCLAVPGGSKTPGTQVIQWPCGEWKDHFWRFDNAGGGRFRLVNYNSQQCLAVQDGSGADGAKVIQWPCGEWNDHFWR
ncbi:heme utilization/adhesion protein [Streptomyces sp. p1417]|uniref:Heme utilization/adhesion protein n=1 Tax=Streptomyces typhae TaxID=2681492 RepID=A0A6L6X225_9ACTN|nr:RICIN domain-containing protein [Streptomyces typhae]MVO87821.1 heme utilization/adhesion protein [Streptomyces typhae]